MTKSLIMNAMQFHCNNDDDHPLFLQPNSIHRALSFNGICCEWQPLNNPTDHGIICRFIGNESNQCHEFAVIPFVKLNENNSTKKDEMLSMIENEEKYIESDKYNNWYYEQYESYYFDHGEDQDIDLNLEHKQNDFKKIDVVSQCAPISISRQRNLRKRRFDELEDDELDYHDIQTENKCKKRKYNDSNIKKMILCES